MQKHQIVALGTEDKKKSFKTNRLFCIIKKDKFLRGFIANLLLKCGFEDNLYLTEYEVNRKDITRFKNTQEHFINNYYDVDLIFADKVVILIIRSKTEKEKKFILNIIREYCEFPAT